MLLALRSLYEQLLYIGSLVEKSTQTLNSTQTEVVSASGAGRVTSNITSSIIEKIAAVVQERDYGSISSVSKEIINTGAVLRNSPSLYSLIKETYSLQGQERVFSSVSSLLKELYSLSLQEKSLVSLASISKELYSSIIYLKSTQTINAHAWTLINIVAEAHFNQAVFLNTLGNVVHSGSLNEKSFETLTSQTKEVITSTLTAKDKGSVSSSISEKVTGSLLTLKETENLAGSISERFLTNVTLSGSTKSLASSGLEKVQGSVGQLQRPSLRLSMLEKIQGAIQEGSTSKLLSSIKEIYSINGSLSETIMGLNSVANEYINALVQPVQKPFVDSHWIESIAGSLESNNKAEFLTLISSIYSTHFENLVTSEVQYRAEEIVKANFVPKTEPEISSLGEELYQAATEMLANGSLSSYLVNVAAVITRVVLKAIVTDYLLVLAKLEGNTTNFIGNIEEGETVQSQDDYEYNVNTNIPDSPVSISLCVESNEQLIENLEVDLNMRTTLYRKNT